MNDIVVRPADLEELTALGTALMQSGFFRDVEKVAQAGVKVLAGRELGLPPVEAMRSLHIVEGKIEMSADLLATRVKQHPRYDYRILRIDETGCDIAFFQDGDELGVSSFTDKDRETAGLALKSAKGAPSSWAKYPRNMMFARAMSNGVAWYCPDVASSGRIYVDGEIDIANEAPPRVVDAATGEIIEPSGETPEQPVAGSGEVAAVVEPGPSSDAGDGGAPAAPAPGNTSADETVRPAAHRTPDTDAEQQTAGTGDASATSEPAAPAEPVQTKLCDHEWTSTKRAGGALPRGRVRCTKCDLITTETKARATK